MKSGHIVASFDDDLSELNQMLAQLGGLAETQFANAIDALERRDNRNIDAIVQGDKQLDELEYELNERALEIIALRSPVAADLRRVVVTLKVAGILERIGDYAKNMAKRSRVIIEHENSKSENVSVARMGCAGSANAQSGAGCLCVKRLRFSDGCPGTVIPKSTAYTPACSAKCWRVCLKIRNRFRPVRICFLSQRILSALVTTRPVLPSRYSFWRMVNFPTMNALRPINLVSAGWIKSNTLRGMT